MRIDAGDGVRLAVDVAGDGPGLVLVHGFGGAKEDFADHLGFFARTHRVVVFDHRGHGESDKPDDPAAYSFARFAADVLAVATAAGLERFDLLGHSMGGMIVPEVALGAPQRVSRLILMDTSHRCPDGIERDLALAAASIATTEGMAKLREVMEASDPLVTPAHARVLAERSGYAEYGERKWFSLSPVMYATMLEAIVDQPDRIDAMRAISCPTLILAGEEDAPFLRQSEAMAGAIPGARYVVIPNAGHSPQFENPEAWREIVATFLAAPASDAVPAPASDAVPAPATQP